MGKTACIAIVAGTLLAAGAATARRHAGPGARHDCDRDGIPDRYDRDRDGDGVPNRFDRAPDSRRWR